MFFNSIEYLLFLPVVFLFYWFVFHKNRKIQNFLILISSYVFYGWWDWRFLFLIFISTCIDYVAGIKIFQSKNTKVRKVWLFLSIAANIGILLFFKYYNFFVDSWVELFRSMGYEIKSIWTLYVILPVGISFYTFQTMSYSLDIYKKKLDPTRDFIAFASFVSFFPQLVAGPIERATGFLPQFLNKRKFRYEQGVQGLRLILWGMFKKVVIADSLAFFVDDVFFDYQTHNGFELLLGCIYFAFQIYADFSGYSDIAIGTAKLFGFELRSNFKFPYFSRDIPEFWRRWHISLSSWFRDYIYIPLGGSREGKFISVRNIFIVFLISGLWHGANWTFVVWGLIHAVFFIPFFVLGINRRNVHTTVAQHRPFPSLIELLQISITFMVVSIAWIFFRSETLTDAIHYLTRIFTHFNYLEEDFHLGRIRALTYCFILVLLEWFVRKDERLSDIPIRFSVFRFVLYIILFFLIFFHFENEAKSFIYFQF